MYMREHFGMSLLTRKHPTGIACSNSCGRTEWSNPTTSRCFPGDLDEWCVDWHGGIEMCREGGSTGSIPQTVKRTFCWLQTGQDVLSKQHEDMKFQVRIPQERCWKLMEVCKKQCKKNDHSQNVPVFVATNQLEVKIFRSLSFRERLIQSQTLPVKFRVRFHRTRHCVLWINQYHFLQPLRILFCFDISWFPATFHSTLKNLLHSLLKLSLIALEHNQWSKNAGIYSKSLHLSL